MLYFFQFHATDQNHADVQSSQCQIITDLRLICWLLPGCFLDVILIGSCVDFISWRDMGQRHLHADGETSEALWWLYKKLTTPSLPRIGSCFFFFFWLSASIFLCMFYCLFYFCTIALVTAFISVACTSVTCFSFKYSILNTQCIAGFTSQPDHPVISIKRNKLITWIRNSHHKINHDSEP